MQNCFLTNHHPLGVGHVFTFFARKESATCVSLVFCLVQLVLFAPVEIVIGQRENFDQRQGIIRGYVTCV